MQTTVLQTQGDKQTLTVGEVRQFFVTMHDDVELYVQIEGSQYPVSRLMFDTVGTGERVRYVALANVGATKKDQG